MGRCFRWIDRMATILWLWTFYCTMSTRRTSWSIFLTVLYLLRLRYSLSFVSLSATDCSVIVSHSLWIFLHTPLIDYLFVYICSVCTFFNLSFLKAFSFSIAIDTEYLLRNKTLVENACRRLSFLGYVPVVLYTRLFGSPLLSKRLGPTYLADFLKGRVEGVSAGNSTLLHLTRLGKREQLNFFSFIDHVQVKTHNNMKMYTSTLL